MTNQELVYYEPDEEDDLELEEPTLEGKTYIYDPDVEDEEEVFAPKRKKTKRTRKPKRKRRLIRYIKRKTKRARRGLVSPKARKIIIGILSVGGALGGIGAVYKAAKGYSWFDSIKVGIGKAINMKFPTMNTVFARLNPSGKTSYTKVFYGTLGVSIFTILAKYLPIGATLKRIVGYLKYLAIALTFGSLILMITDGSLENETITSQSNEQFSEYDPFR